MCYIKGFYYLFWILLSGFSTCMIQAQSNKSGLLSNSFSDINAKLSLPLKLKANELLGREEPFLLKINHWNDFQIFLHQKNLQNHILEEYPQAQLMLLSVTPSQLFQEILPQKNISFADIRTSIPQEERAIKNFDLSVNKINVLHRYYPALNGKNIRIAIKENRFDSVDIDVIGRYIPSGLSNSTVSTHATNMATMIAGAGNSFYSGKGVAWRANLASTSFFNILPDQDDYFQSSGVFIQNHSYGVDIENYYGGEALAYDHQVYSNKQIVHVFSAGNSGDQTSQSGRYEGIESWANLSGNFKMAKNVLVIGAVDSFMNVLALSSKGPAFDGRIKPELVTYGQDGSSGAAAITSGIVAILQQAYSEAHRGQIPNASLVRATLINSADDIGNFGPDFSSGYGNIHALRAAKTIEKGNFFEGKVKQNETIDIPIDIPFNAINIKITLAWLDAAANANTEKALVNDLDLELIHPSMNQIWHPWVLNHFPHPDSLAAPAKRGIDRLNNQEQISIQNPEPGLYIARVYGHKIESSSQTFSVCFDWDTLNHFEWIFPTSIDNALAAADIPVRWEAISRANAIIEYRFLNSEEWVIIDSSANLAAAYTMWKVPDTLALAQLRMRSNGQIVLSDTIRLSKPLTLKAELDCEDIFSLSWNAEKTSDEYLLYGLQSNRLQPLFKTKDTSIVLNKADFSSRYYAVAPVIDGTNAGQKSPTINIDFQRVGCYITSFLADLNANAAELKLTLGSLYQVAEILFEKKWKNQFIQIASLATNGNQFVQFDDLDLFQGINTYRVGIKLVNGQIIYSEEDLVIYAEPHSYLIFPNPIDETEEITIITQETEDSEFRLFDAIGKLIIKYPIRFPNEFIPTDQLGRGLYFYHFVLKGEKIEGGKILVK